MALNAYAELTIDGSALDGDTTMSEIGGIDVSSNHIECFTVSWGSRVNNKFSGRRRSKVTRQPVSIFKPIDKTTPLLYKALATNQRVDGSIKIFGADPDSGETRHFFTLKLEQARINSMESISPNTLSADNAMVPPSEQVELMAETLTYTDEINGIEYEDR